MDGLYKGKQVQEILGKSEAGHWVMKVSRIQDYCVKGYIVPHQDSAGPGTVRWFSGRNIVEILLVDELFKAGVHRDFIKPAMDYFRARAKDYGRYLDPLAPPPAGDKLLVMIFFSPDGTTDYVRVSPLKGADSSETMPSHRRMASIDATKLTREIARKV